MPAVRKCTKHDIVRLIATLFGALALALCGSRAITLLYEGATVRALPYVALTLIAFEFTWLASAGFRKKPRLAGGPLGRSAGSHH